MVVIVDLDLTIVGNMYSGKRKTLPKQNRNVKVINDNYLLYLFLNQDKIELSRYCNF